MSLSRHQSARQIHDIRRGNKWFQNVAQFRYWKRLQQIKALFRSKLRGDQIQVLFAAIQPRTFFLVACCLKTKIRHKTGILPVVLYGCGTWSLSLRKEHRLRVLEKRMLRRIFWSKRDEVWGGWRILRNEELHNSYSSPSIIKMIKSKRMRLAGHVARIGRRIYIYI
jgi:hypothetical protein